MPPVGAEARPSDCSLADLPETDDHPAVNVLSLTQVYLDILCHVTYILDTLQGALRHYVQEQNFDGSVLDHVDQQHLELDPFVQNYGDQVALSIPDSVCSDSPSQAEGLTLRAATTVSTHLEDWTTWSSWGCWYCNWLRHLLGKALGVVFTVGEKSSAHIRTRLDCDVDPALIYIWVGIVRGVVDPDAFRVGVSDWYEGLVSSCILMEHDGCDLTLSAILEVKVQSVDDWECPESRSSCCSHLVILELDRAREDCGPELVVHGIRRLENLKRFESKADPGVGVGYRAEDFVVFVVSVEPAPDSVQEVELASRHGVTDRNIEVSLNEEPVDLLRDDFLECFCLRRRSAPRVDTGTVVHHRLGSLHGAGSHTLSVRVVLLVEAEPVVVFRCVDGLPSWPVVELDAEAHIRFHVRDAAERHGERHGVVAFDFVENGVPLTVAGGVVFGHGGYSTPSKASKRRSRMLPF